jgi:hypothetical protein
MADRGRYVDLGHESDHGDSGSGSSDRQQSLRRGQRKWPRQRKAVIVRAHEYFPGIGDAAPATTRPTDHPSANLVALATASDRRQPESRQYSTLALELSLKKARVRAGSLIDSHHDSNVTLFRTARGQIDDVHQLFLPFPRIHGKGRVALKGQKTPACSSRPGVI